MHTLLIIVFCFVEVYFYDYSQLSSLNGTLNQCSENSSSMEECEEIT